MAKPQRTLTWEGKTQTIRQWANEWGLPWSTLMYRVQAGITGPNLKKPYGRRDILPTGTIVGDLTVVGPGELKIYKDFSKHRTVIVRDSLGKTKEIGYRALRQRFKLQQLQMAIPINTTEDIWKAKISILRQREFFSRQARRKTPVPMTPATLGDFTLGELKEIINRIYAAPFKKDHYISFPSGHYIIHVNV